MGRCPLRSMAPEVRRVSSSPSKPPRATERWATSSDSPRCRGLDEPAPQRARHPRSFQLGPGSGLGAPTSARRALGGGCLTPSLCLSASPNATLASQPQKSLSAPVWRLCWWAPCPPLWGGPEMTPSSSACVCASIGAPVPSLQLTLGPCRARNPPPGLSLASAPRAKGTHLKFRTPQGSSPDALRPRGDARASGLGGARRGTTPHVSGLGSICVYSFPVRSSPAQSPKSLHYFSVNRAFPSQNNQHFSLLAHLALIGPRLAGWMLAP